MKLSHALMSITTAAALALGALVPAASAAEATEPVTLVGPENAEKLKTPYVKFSWQAPVDEQDVQIYVSTSNKIVSNGKLSQKSKDYLTTWDADAGATSFIDKRYSYSPDTYYWQVETTDAAGTEYLSKVQKFVVPVIFDLSKVKVKAVKAAYNGKRVVEGSAVMQCNYPEDQYYTQFTMDVYQGKKLLSRSGVAQGNCVGMYKTKTAAIFEPPASMKSGTKLTLKLYGNSTHNSTVKYGGAAIKKAKGPVTTVKFTWKK